MEIIPAIDLKGGKAVRLRQGEFTQVETYTEDPVKYAMRWQDEGARRLHVVDLDGARIGSPQTDNLNVLRQIMRRVQIPVQFGGGVRSWEIVQRMIGIGVERVVLGTSAAQDEAATARILESFGDQVVIGIDAKDSQVAIRGWQERLDESAVSFARRMSSLGARRIVFTDIARDGMLNGPNIGALKEMLAAVPTRVIASGGVGSLDDVRALAAVQAPNLEGAIIGKALYAGRMTVAQAISAV